MTRSTWRWIGFLGVVLILVGGHAVRGQEGFAPEVETLLVQRMEILVELSRDPTLVAAATGNAEHQGLTSEAIKQLDRAWIEANEITDLMRTLLTNTCAQRLAAFQDTHDEFAEIFVTDARGLIVCTTNRTSDYYQADEDWWTQAYAGGQGRLYHGELEYDESAHAEAISLYVPLRDGTREQAIGVIKAVCDVTALMMEL